MRSQRISILVPILLLVIFMVPFGHLQGAVFGGLTMAKIVLPMLFLLLLIVKSGELKIHPNLLHLLGFIVFTTPSFLQSVDYGGVFLSLVGYVIIFEILCNAHFTTANIRRILLSFLFGLLVISVATIMAYRTGTDLGKLVGHPLVEIWYGSPVLLGSAVNPNGFATFFVPGIPIVLLFVITVRGFFGKMFFLSIAAFLGLILLMTYSRSAILGAAIGCLVLLHFRSSNSKLSWSLFFKLGLLLILGYSAMNVFREVLLFFSTGDIADQTVSVVSNKDISLSYRTLVLGPMLSIFLLNPFFGIGFGNLPDLLDQAIGLHINAHNMFFGIAVEYGIFALIFFCLIIWSSINAMLNALNHTRDRVIRTMIACFLGALIGLIVHGIFHEIYVNFTLWFFIAFGHVLKMWVLSEENRRAF